MAIFFRGFMVRKNIFAEIKKNPVQIVLLVVSQILAIIAILLSFGVFYNNEYTMKEGEFLDTSFGVYFETEVRENLNEIAKSDVKISEIQNYLPDILKAYSDISEGSILYSESLVGDSFNGIPSEYLRDREYLTWLSTIDYKDGKPTFSMIDDNSKTGVNNYFSLDEIQSGEKVCIVNSYLNDCSNGFFNMGTDKYKIIGTESSAVSSMNTDGMVPFFAMDDEMVPTDFYINFSRPITGIEYNDLVEKFTSAFGNKVSFSEKKVISIDEKATFVSSMIMAIFVALISAYCVSLIVSFILKRRMSMTAIYRICGASTLKAWSLYCSELVVILFITGAIGYFAYMNILMPRLLMYFNYFTIIYRGFNHIKIIVIYEAVIMLTSCVVVAYANFKSPKELLRRAAE